MTGNTKPGPFRKGEKMQIGFDFMGRLDPVKAARDRKLSASFAPVESNLGAQTATLG